MRGTARAQALLDRERNDPALTVVIGRDEPVLRRLLLEHIRTAPTASDQ